MPRKKAKSTDEEIVLVTDVEGDEEFDAFEDYQDLFQGEADETVKVELYRVKPDQFNGIPTKGYLCTLEVDDSYDTIMRRFGGGKYKIAKKVNGRFAQQKIFEIAGNPVIHPTGTGKAGLSASSPNGGPSGDILPATDQFDGIGIGGDFNQFLSRMERIKAIKELFPDKDDINTDLLKVFIASQSNRSSLLGDVKEVLGLINELKDNGSSSAGGWTGLIQKGLDVILNKPGGPDPGTGQVIQQPGPEPVITPINRNQLTDKTSSNSMPQDSMSAIVDQATNIICEAYYLQPPLRPCETKDLITNIIPGFGPEVQAEIEKNHSLITNITRMKFKLYYEDQFAQSNTPDEQYDLESNYKLFKEYYDEVFNRLIQREGDCTDESEQQPGQ